jgi:hypothetical protein
MIKICKVCNKEFNVPLSRVSSAVTCSLKCRDIYNSTGKNFVITHCDHCGKEVQRYPSQLKNKNGIFCSRECQNQAKTVHIYTCERCKKMFHRSVRIGQVVRYCSQKCHYEARREETLLNCTCAVCGKRFHKYDAAVADGEGVYCSWECKKLGSRVPHTANGSTHVYALARWKEIRKRVLDRDGYTCQLCGDKTKQLHVHHREIRRIGMNDDMDNLVTLCKSCHKIVEMRDWKKIFGGKMTLNRILSLKKV